MFGRGKKTAGVVEPSGLRERLERNREVTSARREDDLSRFIADADHRLAVAEVRGRAAEAKRTRREIRTMSRLYRRAMVSGARARLRAQIQESAEARALRLARVRTVSLLAGIPILAAFGGWSTTGVHAGVSLLLNLEPGTPGWWAAWVVEPALIAVVALIIVGRSVLRSAGGDTDERAATIEKSALGLSIVLNTIGGWPTDGLSWAAAGAALAHAVGPFGAAGTAYLLGAFDDYVSRARPWQGAPRLADLDITLPDLTTLTTLPIGQPAVNLDVVAGEGHRDEDSAAAVSFTDAAVQAPRSNRDQGERSTVAVRRDRGRKVPAVAKKPARRASRSVAELAADLDEAIRSGRLTEDASVNQIRLALECSPARAKEAIAYRASEVHRPKLAVVGEQAVNE